MVLAFLSVPVGADTESGSQDSSTLKLLHNAFYMGVDISVSESSKQQELLRQKISKVTIPGRQIEIDLSGFESRMSVNLTLYPSGEKKLILLARCETWIAGNYEISISSMPVSLKDKILYFPLGRPGDGEPAKNNSVEVMMQIDIMPFMETLDGEKLDQLKEVIDNKSSFRIVAPENP